MKSIILSVLMLHLAVLGFAQGSAMLVAAEPATVVVDGQGEILLDPYAPHRIELALGEHSLLATSNRGAEVERTFSVVEGKQELIQITFPEYVPPVPQKKAVMTPVQVADVKIVAQSFAPFNVASSRTFKAVSEAYYTFAKGDTVIIDVASANPKGTYFVELIRYSDWTPVSFTEVTGKTTGIKVPVAATDIFILRIGSTNGKDQEVHLNLKRIPIDPVTADFITVTEKYSQFDVVRLLEQTKLLVNSTSHEKWQGGKNEASIPLDIPPDITEWYFTVAITIDEVDINQDMGQFSLYEDLFKVVGDKKAMTRQEAKHFKVDLDAIKQPEGDATADIYLLTYENAQKFSAEEMFVYIKDGTREAVESAKVKVTCCTGGHFYIGIRNKDVYKGVHAVVEAVGIRRGLFLARPVDRK